MEIVDIYTFLLSQARERTFGGVQRGCYSLEFSRMLFTGVQWGCFSLEFSREAVHWAFSGDAPHWSSIFSLERLTLPGVKGIDPIFPLK